MSEILQSDVIEWAKSYTGKPYHAMFLDPPYHLTSITKRFGKPASAPAKGGVYGRSSAGFMGQTWDGGDIAFQPETWEALGNHLYPGAFIMAFAGTRGYHRMACAMEDAGLIIHPAIGWCFLSGFPKATRIDTQIDKAAGVDRETVGNYGRSFRPHADQGNQGWQRPSHEVKGDITAPATDQARDWSGHRYGLQALKPAFEFIAVAQRPYEGRPVDNITATGAGSLWIDGGRIGTGNLEQWRTGKNESITGSESGRWPSNLILSHHPDCNGVCVPGCGVRALDEQAGITGQQVAGGFTPKAPKFNGRTYQNGEIYEGDKRESREPLDDPGPASRMFHRASWQYEVAEQLANATPLRYEPKASSTEREIGLDRLETKTRHRVNAGGLENEPRFAPTQVKNNHPTVKSISLTKYLATLLLPPIAYAPRRILIPFSGVASECIGATLAGWEEVTGIEMSAAYCEIARARLAWWSQWPGWGQTDVDKILAVSEDQAQLSLFTEAA